MPLCHVVLAVRTKWFITSRNEVLAKVIFSQACVKNSVHRGVPDQAGLPPRTRQVPPGTRPPQTRHHHPRTKQVPPNPPWTRHPPGTRHPHPSDQTPLPGTAVRSTFGQYASYWNAFLFVCINFQEQVFTVAGCLIRNERLKGHLYLCFNG